MKGYMTLTEASLKFNVSTRLLSLYCNQRRIKDTGKAEKIAEVIDEAQLKVTARKINAKCVYKVAEYLDAPSGYNGLYGPAPFGDM